MLTEAKKVCGAVKWPVYFLYTADCLIMQINTYRRSDIFYSTSF